MSQQQKTPLRFNSSFFKDINYESYFSSQSPSLSLSFQQQKREKESIPTPQKLTFEEEEDFTLPSLKTARSMAQPLSAIPQSKLGEELQMIQFPAISGEKKRFRPIDFEGEEYNGFEISSKRTTKRTFLYGERDEQEDGFCILVHGFEARNRVRVLAHFDQIGEMNKIVSEEGKNWIAIEYKQRQAQRRAFEFDGSFVGGSVVGVAEIQSFEDIAHLVGFSSRKSETNRRKNPRITKRDHNAEFLPHIHQSSARPEISTFSWIFSTAGWIGKTVYSFFTNQD
jgi:hypothetical protein